MLDIGQLGQQLVYDNPNPYVTLRVFDGNIHHSLTFISANRRERQSSLNFIAALHSGLHSAIKEIDISRVVCTTKLGVQFLTSTLPKRESSTILLFAFIIYWIFIIILLTGMCCWPQNIRIFWQKRIYLFQPTLWLFKILRNAAR